MQFRLLDTDSSLEDRGIVTAPGKFAQSWLTLRQATSERDFLSVVESIYPYYRINFDAWAGYFYDDICDTPAQRKRAVHKAEKTKGITEDTLQCIINDYTLRNQNKG